MTKNTKPTATEDPHIVVRYDEELGALQQLVKQMGARALSQVQEAVNALMTADVVTARRVVSSDRQLNYMDMDGKEKAVALFAVRTPVARDLRVVMALHQTVGMLEHIGDEAKGIAEIVVRVFEEDRVPPTSDLMRDVTHMGNLAVGMLESALTALDERDVDAAVAVLKRTEDMKAEFRSALRRLSTFVMEDARNLKHSIDMICVYRSLERVGDYAKNLGEQVIYIVKGKDVRYMNVDNLANGYLED